MTLKQLRYFVEVYQTLSFTQAAENLYVSQPAISKSLRELESEWGFRLFERNRSGMEPTREGRIAFNAATSLLAQADSFSDAMSLLGKGKPRLSIVVNSAISLLLYPQMIYNFMSQNPDIDVQIVEVKEHADQRLKSDPSTDILLAANAQSYFDNTEFVRMPLLDTEYVILASPSTSVAQHEFITDDVKCDEPLIIDYRPTDIHKETYIPRRLTSFLNGNSMRVLSSQIALNIEMIALGQAYGLFFRESAKRYHDLVSIPFRPSWRQSIDAYYSQPKCSSPALARFIRYLQGYDWSSL